MNLFLWVVNSDNIRLRLSWSLLSLRVPVKHNLNLKTKNSLSHVDVSGALRHEVSWDVSRPLHVSVLELHGLCSLSSDLTSNDNLNTLSLGFHHELHNSVACTTDWKSSNEFVSQRLSLSDGRQTSVHDTLSVQFNSSFWESESLLNN